MTSQHPILIELPMPIRTPRLILRPKQVGDGAATASAIQESWEELHQWMRWAEHREAFTAESMEIRTRQVMASFILRETIEVTGVEIASGRAVIWCGFHSLDWQARQCDTGYWVARGAQNQGFATEATNALLRYAFGVLRMQRVGLTHAAGNEASRRVAQKLGFAQEGIQRSASYLPDGRIVDRYCYARLDLADLPHLDVHWD
jgi:RimJ/RimL family protein N-acetyltransferase